MTDLSCNTTTKCFYSTKQPSFLFIVRLNVEEQAAVVAVVVVEAVAVVVAAAVQDI